MKFTKLLALLLAICMLGAMMVACNKEEEKNDDTEAPGTPAPAITVVLTIKDGGKTVVEDRPVSYVGDNPTLGEIIGNYCAEEAKEGEEYEPFDENAMLVQIGDLKKESGKRWTAYLREEGMAKEFASIKDQPVADGQHIIVALING